jgi:hypothetical protein
MPRAAGSLPRVVRRRLISDSRLVLFPVCRAWGVLHRGTLVAKFFEPAHASGMASPQVIQDGDEIPPGSMVSRMWKPRRRSSWRRILSCRAVPVTSIIIELQEGDRLGPVSLLGFNSARH